MTRPLRIQYPNAHYHVMNRGISRAPIFDIDDDYDIFLETLKESLALHEVQLFSYCLMTNHYHLLIKTPKGNLSRFMRHLSALYTQRHNRLHKKDGPIFRGRYKAILVQEDAYLIHLVRYIHLNPIEANLVQELGKYRWTSHGYYLKAKDQHWLCVTEPLSYFAKTSESATKEYIHFIKSGLDPKTKAFFSLKHHDPVFGDEPFVDRIKEQYLKNNASEIYEGRSMRGQWILSQIEKTVSKALNVSPKTLYSSTRGRVNRSRSMAIALARELSGLKLDEIARHFQIASYKTISAHHRRLHNSFTKNKQLANSYHRMKSHVSK